MSTVQDVLLGIEFGVQVCVLLLPVDQEVLLIIDFLAESRDHVDVHLDTRLVVVLHAPFLVSDSVEVLLEGKELVLKQLVLTLLLS